MNPKVFSGSDNLGSSLGGECSIQLSYEDISDFWLKISLSSTFQASGSVAGYSITYAFWMNCSIQLSSIHSPLVASYITLTLTDSNYRVLFPIVQRRQAGPFLRRRTLYPAELQRHLFNFWLISWVFGTSACIKKAPKSGSSNQKEVDFRPIY